MLGRLACLIIMNTTGEVRNAWRIRKNGSKGAPAQESHTSTRLVSPAASGEKKKKDPCRTGPCNFKFGTLAHDTVSTADPCCSTAWIDNNLDWWCGFTEAIQPCIGSTDLRWGHLHLHLSHAGHFNPVIGLMALHMPVDLRRWCSDATCTPDELPRLCVSGGMHGLVAKVVYSECMRECVGSQFGP